MKQYNALEKLLGSRFDEVRGHIIKNDLSGREKLKLRKEIDSWVSIFGNVVRVAFELHLEPKILYDFLR